MPRSITLSVAAALVVCGGAAAGAQDTPPAAATAPPAVGTMAPDFSIPGATRYGLLRDPVRLSDFRGKTVVISFFFRARTRG